MSPPTEEADSHLDSASIHRPYNTENQIPPVEHHTLLLEPSDHRAALRIRPMLRQRLEFLWGDSNTYVGTCSERFSNTMAGFWYYMVQQQAEAVFVSVSIHIGNKTDETHLDRTIWSTTVSLHSVLRILP